MSRAVSPMPEKVTEELVGVNFVVRKGETPVTDDQGNVVFNGGDGGPKMQELWILDLVDQNPFRIKTVRVPLSEENRDELVRQLTGGIAIATAMPVV